MPQPLSPRPPLDQGPARAARLRTRAAHPVRLRTRAARAARVARLKKRAAISAGVGLILLASLPASFVVPAAADPAPSASEVARGRQRAAERAAEVGRIKSRLAHANGQLRRLAVAAEVAVERYNGELVKLDRARRAAQDARVRLAAAQQRHEGARAEMAEFAASAYRTSTGYNSWSMAVGGDGGPQGFMDRAGMVEILARRQAGVMQRVQATRNIADMFRRQAETALNEQRSATRRAAEAKRAAASAVARQRSAVVRIEAHRRELERELGAARADAAALERRREAALYAASSDGGSIGHPPAVHGSGRGSIVVRSALKWLGTPYSWGGGTAAGPSYGIEHGAGIRGFDCSGLALYAWSKVGVRLDHWTGTQWTSGPHVPIGSLRPGDLVFFAYNTNDPDTIHHVGIFLSRGRMVEAPFTGARVRISSIWRNGLIGATRPAG